MHVLAIGDIGPVDDMIHIGDEAMFDEATRQLTRRGVARITGISSHPADTATRYGIDAVPALGSSSVSDEEALESPLGHALRDADAVLVTGAGNLSSLWPSHIVERGRLARLAQRRGIPFVISGQTFGPALNESDRAEVGRMLRSARLVGTRERPSYDLARTLGVASERLGHTIDDASFLGWQSGVPLPVEPVAVVTIARHVGDSDQDAALTAYARLLDAAAEATGLEIVFHAHFASLRDGEVRGDSAVHQQIIERMRSSRVRVERTTDAPAAARLARSASLVVNSRYHPAVFAASGGVPTIGVPVDDYTTVKLRGAIGAVGGQGIVPISELIATDPSPFVEEFWSRRGAMRATAHELLIPARQASEVWWDRVHTALTEG